MLVAGQFRLMTCTDTGPNQLSGQVGLKPLRFVRGLRSRRRRSTAHPQREIRVSRRKVVAECPSVADGVVSVASVAISRPAAPGDARGVRIRGRKTQLPVNRRDLEWSETVA